MKNYLPASRKLSPTVAQFQQLVLLDQQSSIDGFDKEIHFAAIMSNMTYQQAAEELTMDQILEINRIYSFPDMNKVVPRLPRRTRIRGKLYKIMPNFTYLKGGEFLDFEHFTRTPDTSVEELHNIMALFVRPYIIPYIWVARRKEPAKRYLDRAKFLQDYAPAEIGCMISAFFLQVWRQLYCRIPPREDGSRRRKMKSSPKKNSSTKPNT